MPTYADEKGLSVFGQPAQPTLSTTPAPPTQPGSLAGTIAPPAPAPRPSLPSLPPNLPTPGTSGVGDLAAFAQAIRETTRTVQLQQPSIQSFLGRFHSGGIPITTPGAISGAIGLEAGLRSARLGDMVANVRDIATNVTKYLDEQKKEERLLRDQQRKNAEFIIDRFLDKGGDFNAIPEAQRRALEQQAGYSSGTLDVLTKTKQEKKFIAYDDVLVNGQWTKVGIKDDGTSEVITLNGKPLAVRKPVTAGGTGVKGLDEVLDPLDLQRVQELYRLQPGEIPPGSTLRDIQNAVKQKNAPRDFTPAEIQAEIQDARAKGKTDAEILLAVSANPIIQNKDAFTDALAKPKREGLLTKFFSGSSTPRPPSRIEQMQEEARAQRRARSEEIAGGIQQSFSSLLDQVRSFNSSFTGQ